MLLVLVVRLSVRDVRNVHHCGDTWKVSVISFSTFAAHLIRREIGFWPIRRLNKLLNYSPFDAFCAFPGSDG